MNGLYIEYNIRGEDGRIYPNVALTSKEFGQETFDLLANGEKVGSVTVDKDINGHNNKFNVPVTYDRAFIVLP
jgi:stress response protein YsnF